MFIRIRDSHTRSICKAISWRILGSLDTFLITFLITRSFVSAGSIASVEAVSKIILYYLHERAWSKVTLGRKGPATEARAGVPAADSQFATYDGATLGTAPVAGIGFAPSSSCGA